MTLALAIGVATTAVWLVMLVGRGGFWRARPPASVAQPASWPSVAVVVPARDEAATIAQVVAGILAQDYPGPLTLWVVDDHSTDGTGDLARAAGDARLTVVTAPPLAPGWTGKLAALEAGVRVSGPSSFLWFTDADIAHPPGTLRALVARAEHDGRLLVSEMVRLRVETFAERATVPAFVYFFAMLYPFAWIADARRRTAGAAGGSVLLRRDALAAAGGLAAIRHALIDDCALAGLVKRQGPIRLDLADGSTSLRGYPDFAAVGRMIARSAFAQLRYSAALLVGCVAGMALVFLAPPLLAILAEGWARALGLFAWVAMAVSFLPMLRHHRVGPGWAPLLPLIALFFLGATVKSALDHWAGRGGMWKGRAQAALGR
jgi:hopene-associated glycosyltransferase HpnB